MSPVLLRSIEHDLFLHYLNRPADSVLPALSESSSGEISPSLGEVSSIGARRSRAILVSVVLTVTACCLLGWGVYAFLASIHVFAIVFDGASLISWKAVLAVIAGSLLAFIAVSVAVVAIVRSRPKVLAVVVLLCGVAMPAIAAAGAGTWVRRRCRGIPSLKPGTMSARCVLRTWMQSLSRLRRWGSRFHGAVTLSHSCVGARRVFHSAG